MDPLPAIAVDDVSLVVVGDLGQARLGVDDRVAVLVLGDHRRGVVAVPERPDVADVAQDVVLDQVIGVVVQDRVVPLVADGQQPVRLAGDLAHLLALGDRVRHQLLGEDVLALLHRLDGDRGVQPQRQGDDDHLDVRDRRASPPCSRTS